MEDSLNLLVGRSVTDLPPFLVQEKTFSSTTLLRGGYAVWKDGRGPPLA